MISIIAYCVEHLLIILLHGSKNSRIDLQVLLISRIDLLVLTNNSVLCILPSVSCCLDADSRCVPRMRSNPPPDSGCRAPSTNLFLKFVPGDLGIRFQALNDQIFDCRLLLINRDWWRIGLSVTA
jgi:hypothetical protein